MRWGIGPPKEAFGFSNDAMGRFGPPDFDDAAFLHGTGDTRIAIELKRFQGAIRPLDAAPAARAESSCRCTSPAAYRFRGGRSMRSMVVTLFAALLAACASAPPEPTRLAKQQLQTRELEGDKRMVFNAVVSVLQDSGYVIHEADFDTGLISGAGEAVPAGFDLSEGISFGGPILTKQTSASVFVQEWGPGQVKVRASFKEARTRQHMSVSAAPAGGAGPITTPGGTYVEEGAIYDAALYQEFFAAMEQTLFVMKGLRSEPAPAE
jgi:hypothetical protein